MALGLRPYQREALDGIEQAEREGVRRPLVVLPTGTGKTVVFSHGIKERATRGRSLVLVHRDELARQTIEKIGMVAPELSAGVVKAGENEVDADVVVASVQTAQVDRRLAQLVEAARRSPFGTIWVDEAHHAPAPSWTKVLKGLGSFNSYGPLTVGFTATPERDKKTLGVWEKLAAFMSIREAIYGNGKKGKDGHEGGYLVPILPSIVVETDMDMRQVGKRGGDFSEGDLGREMEESGAIVQIADAYVEHASDRKAVAFTPTVATAHALAGALRARGVAAEALDGTTPTEERRAMLRRLKTGETWVLVNCGVLTEGFDEPSISCVIVARPTKFHGLYVQMIGRGTRLHPGKKDLLILDLVGASKRHEFVGYVDLGLELDEGRQKKEGEPERQPCPTCGEPCEVEEHRCSLCSRYLPVSATNEGEHRHENCRASGGGRVDVFGASRLSWLPVGPAWVLGAGKEIVVMVPDGVDAWKLAAYENGKVKVLHEEIPSDWAMGIGEDRAKAFQRLAERDARWRNAPASVLQRGRLVREGLPESKVHLVKTQGDAADLITRISGRRAVKKLGVRL
jgi:superfamily II DNA or RNA helicase